MTSTTGAAVATMAVLTIAGAAPTVAIIGRRWIVLPLVPLTGSILAALAATGYLATGGSFLGWFMVLSVVATAAAALYWWRRPDERPWRGPFVDAAGHQSTVVGVLGALAVIGTCAWSLRGLATPTVGFDARAIWLLRGGWFLQSHHELLVKMRVGDVVLVQSVYPPLVSAVTSLAWRVTGVHTMRLGVVVVALLNACTVIVASSALILVSRAATLRTTSWRAGSIVRGRPTSPPASPTVRLAGASLVPMIIGVVSAVLLVFVAFGITEPFITNGYADPIWSMAAVGAVAYGLQSGPSRASAAATVVLVLVAGLSKDEGLATGSVLIALVALRGLRHAWTDGPRRQWWRPVAVGAAELVAIAAWPVVVRVIHSRGLNGGRAPARAWMSRTHAAYDGTTPYLHVLVLAIPVAVVGGVVLARVRRGSGLANDWWAWLALAGGFAAVIGAFAVGTAAITPWLEGTVHRVTEFPALAAWWIVATWAVVAGVAVVAGPAPPPTDSATSGAGLEVPDGGAVPMVAPLRSAAAE